MIMWHFIKIMTLKNDKRRHNDMRTLKYNDILWPYKYDIIMTKWMKWVKTWHNEWEGKMTKWNEMNDTGLNDIWMWMNDMKKWQNDI